jgi:hypothetical protein
LRHVLPKPGLTFNGLHSVILQKIKFFITTTVRNSKLILYSLSVLDFTVFDNYIFACVSFAAIARRLLSHCLATSVFAESLPSNGCLC